jgi:glutamate-ammonia-ligase adenylyltransferase
MAMLRPFVYRRYLDFGAIDSLRSLKAMIDREVKRKGMERQHQARPRRHPRDRVHRPVVSAHSRRARSGPADPADPAGAALLGAKGLLPAAEVHELTAAYRFLRLVENRIQAWQDRQTHVLPEKPDARLRLARSMGFPDWDGFEPSWTAHRAAVQARFDGIFAEPGGDEHAARRTVERRADRRRRPSACSADGFMTRGRAGAAGRVPRRRDRAARAQQPRASDLAW